MPGSSLHGNRVVPALKPPFDIIYRIAQEARACESARPAREGEKNRQKMHLLPVQPSSPGRTRTSVRVVNTKLEVPD